MNRLGARVAAQLMTRLAMGLAARRPEGDRGDVPGWVLITVMTAGLVAAIWAVAEPRLVELFDTSLSGVTNGP